MTGKPIIPIEWGVPIAVGILSLMSALSFTKGSGEAGFAYLICALLIVPLFINHKTIEKQSKCLDKASEALVMADTLLKTGNRLIKELKSQLITTSFECAKLTRENEELKERLNDLGIL